MFEISEITDLPVGSIGLIYDSEGNPVQGFLRVQVQEEDPLPQFLLTMHEFGTNVLIENIDIFDIEQSCRLVASRKLLPLFTQERFQEYLDHGDEEGLKHLLGDMLDLLAAAPYLVLAGNSQDNSGSLCLALRTTNGWRMNDSGYSSSEALEGLSVPLLEEGTAEADYSDTKYEGLIEVFPYRIIMDSLNHERINHV